MHSKLKSFSALGVYLHPLLEERFWNASTRQTPAEPQQWSED